MSKNMVYALCCAAIAAAAVFAFGELALSLRDAGLIGGAS